MVLNTSPLVPPKKTSTRKLLYISAILAAMLVSIRFLPVTPITGYAAIFIASSLLYWVLCRLALHAEMSKGKLALTLLLLICVRFSFIGMAPLGSDDVYRYMWDGRVQTAGINPYRFAPENEELHFLRTERLPSLVNLPQMKTVYFPLSQWLFYIGYHLSGEHIWGFQLLVLISEILTVIGLLLLMAEFSYSPWRVLLYAANPLIVLQFSLDAHLDAFGFPFLVFALLFYHRNKIILSLILLGCSLLIKPVALVMLPILFLDQQGFVNKAKVVVLPLAVVLFSFLPYTFGVNPVESAAIFSKHWAFNGALFNALWPLFADNQATRLWCFALLAGALLGLYRSKKSLHEKTVYAVLLLLLCSPVVHPWYIGWLIVLLPLAPISSGLVLAGTASLTSVTFVTYQLQGVWREYPIVLVLEYVPVIAFLVFDLTRGRKKEAGT